MIPKGARKTSWKTSQLASEAFANVFSLHSRFKWALVLIVLVGIAVTVFQFLEIYQLKNQIASQGEAGRNVLIASSSDPSKEAKISRSSCEALSSREGVERSGVLIDDGQKFIPQFGRNVSLIGSSASLFQQLHQSVFVVGSELTTQPSGTSHFVNVQMTTALGVIADKQAIGISTNNALVYLLPSTVQIVDHCIVLLLPTQLPELEISNLQAELVSAGNPIAFVRVSNTPTDIFKDFQNRPGRFLPAFISLFLGSLLFVVMLGRSSEFATYLLSGTSPKSLRILVLFESSIVAGLYWISASSSAVMMSFLDAPEHLASQALSHFLVAFGIVIIVGVGFVPFSLRPPMKMAKNR